MQLICFITGYLSKESTEILHGKVSDFVLNWAVLYSSPVALEKVTMTNVFKKSNEIYIYIKKHAI